MKERFLKAAGFAFATVAFAGASFHADAEVFNNEPARIFWPMETASDFEAPSEVVPASGFSITNFDVNGNTVKGVEKPIWADFPFIKLQPVTGKEDYVIWQVTPAKGLTFTPTKLSAWITRFGTDQKSSCSVTAKTKEGKSAKLATYTAARANKDADDTYIGAADYTRQFEIILTEEQKALLTTTEGFEMVINSCVPTGKQFGFAHVEIEGLLNGETIEVAKYPVVAVANPEEGGSVTVKPAVESYEEGAEITLMASENFGYDFVNWTDAAGNVVSETPEFKMTVAKAETLSANFKKVNTYELAVDVTNGANGYMVELTPAPTVVDGKNMYEEGTNVTLKAISNPILQFTNWNDGQTSSEISVEMDSDKAFTADYAASDFIVGWDFYLAGASGRAADFASEDNDDAALVMRTADGTTGSWLDKSQKAAGGYEGKPAAVNWKTEGLGKYYWQTKVNASAFKDLKVITAMLYNYNAYTRQLVEYSLNGEEWNTVDTIVLTAAKKWVNANIALPAAANNQPEVYIRWISDMESAKAGTTSNNDGIALGATYIVGQRELIDDGTAPVLLSTVPADGATTASTNGKIVLTFDEKVMIAEEATATLAGTELSGEANGKTVVFTYKNLNFDTKYEFILPGNSIADLTGNYMEEPVRLSFTTRSRPEVAKGVFDFIVPNDGDFRAAITAANNREDKTTRFRIFVRNGNYLIPMDREHEVTVNGGTFPDVTLRLSASNTSIIGESREGVVIVNEVPDMDGTGSHPMEGIGNADLLQILGGVTGTYIQDITFKHGISDARGRNIVLQDKGDKTIMKNVCLWGYQDTWTSNNQNARYYFEGGLLRGRTDFLCGKGDALFNGVNLQMCEKGGYLAVPSVPKQYGYVFRDCEITGGSNDIDGNYTLGRPWGNGTPIALFIDTKMTVKPSATGWADMGSDGYPARFAEYNSTTASGTVIDLANRKKTFGSEKHPNNPVLTKAEADAANYAAVMGGDDDWDPALDCEAAPSPEGFVVRNGGITWDDSKYALCWAVYADGEFIGFTSKPSFTAATRSETTYAIRAVNEMGGLGETVTNILSGVENVNAATATSKRWFNLQGLEVVPGEKTQVLIEVTTLEDGTVKTLKVIK